MAAILDFKITLYSFWQCNPVNLHPNSATHNIRLPRMFSLCWQHARTWGNPFIEDSGDMLTLDTKVIMNKDAIWTVNAVEEIGQRQFSESVVDRLKIASNKPLSDIVSNNKLALFSTPQTKQRSRSKEQVASLKTKCTLSSRFYIACLAIQSNLDSFFEHENQASISDMAQLWQGSKSDLMECLTKSSQPASIHRVIDAKVLDGAAIVHMVRPGALSNIWGVGIFPANFSSVYHLSAWNCQQSRSCLGQVSNRHAETIYKGS